MNKLSLPRLLLLAGTLLAVILLAMNWDTRQTSHPSQPASLGKPVSMAAMEASLASPGNIAFTMQVSADWQVPLSGLLNLNSDEAKAAGLVDKDEPIEVYLYEFIHPTHGRFFIDTGVAKALLDNPADFGVGSLLHSAFGFEKLKLRRSSGELAAGAPLAGILLTHLHLDHISGLPELAKDIPIYTGTQEAHSHGVLNLFTRKVADTLLAGRPALNEWRFDEQGVIDIFGDASVFALKVPGHTEGSSAYVLNTRNGPVLIVGDTSHTAWGWQHGVEPGDFTQNQPLNRQSLLALKALSERQPQMQVYLGHQRL